MRREIAITVGWVGAVMAAAVVGVTAIGALGEPAREDPALTQQEISGALAEAEAAGQRRVSTSAPPGGTPTGSPSPGSSAATAVRRYVNTPGGTLWASCADGQVRLESVTPKQGFRVDGRQLGPATSAWVAFKLDADHGHQAEYHVTVVCVGGLPRERVTGED